MHLRELGPEAAFAKPLPRGFEVGANKATEVGLTPDEAGSLHVLGPAHIVENQDLREFGRF